MPVNMDPSKKRRKPAPPSESEQTAQAPAVEAPHEFGAETETDRQKDLAEAEWKNLWDAMEVIDMDTF